MNTKTTSSIARHAKKTESDTETGLPEEIKDALDRVDLLIADLGQLSEFTAKATTFVDEAGIEIRWNRRARLAVVVVAGIFLLGIARLLWLVLTDAKFDSLRAAPGAFSTVVAASIGGGVVLAIGVTRAVFSTFSERNSGMPMPEHLKSVADAVGSLFHR